MTETYCEKFVLIRVFVRSYTIQADLQFVQKQADSEELK